MKKYQGSIYPAQAFSTNTATDPYLIKLKDAFIQHWRYGHHPDLGRDTLFARPEEILNYHIRKVHIKTPDYSDKHGFNGTKKCWDEWEQGRLNKYGKVNKIPTSDAYLIYAVSDQRHAALLAFWEPPAHTKADIIQNTITVIDQADEFYRKKKFISMDRIEHPWDYKWEMP